MNRSPLNRGLGVALLAALLLSLVAAAGCQSYQEGSSRTVGEFTDEFMDGWKVGLVGHVKSGDLARSIVALVFLSVMWFLVVF